MSRPSVVTAPGHDRGHGAPRDAQQHGEHAQCSVGGKPRAGVFESPGVGAAPGRAHGTWATTTPCSTHAVVVGGFGQPRPADKPGGPDVQSGAAARPHHGPRVIADTASDTASSGRLRAGPLGRTENTSTFCGPQALAACGRSRSSSRSPCSGPRARSRIPWMRNAVTPSSL